RRVGRGRITRIFSPQPTPPWRNRRSLLYRAQFGQASHMRIEDFTQQLIRNDEGVYVGPGSSPVSYAAEGHAGCFQVEDASFWFRHRNNCIANMVANQPFRGAMLDIGGGNGYVAQRLSNEGHDVVLLEPGPPVRTM